MILDLPDSSHRWRCGGGGNLTRFDVLRVRRATEFWLFDLAGDHEVGTAEVMDQCVESVSCRWCGRGNAIDVLDRKEASSQDDATDQPTRG